jgi:hypothetical protein
MILSVFLSSDFQGSLLLRSLRACGRLSRYTFLFTTTLYHNLKSSLKHGVVGDTVRLNHYNTLTSLKTHTLLNIDAEAGGSATDRHVLQYGRTYVPKLVYGY